MDLKDIKMLHYDFMYNNKKHVSIWNENTHIDQMTR